jgi:Na+-translocating ferredoxin:NAD+ oxidoreductase subunit B
MFGRVKDNNRRGRHGVNNTNDFCICPQCSSTFQHEQGISCRSVLCPYCNIYLMRGNANSENSKTDENSKKRNLTLEKENCINLPKANDFPGINTEICKGCGACIDVCPKNAITMVNGKASIAEEKCKKCRICVSACPVGAII